MVRLLTGVLLSLFSAGVLAAFDPSEQDDSRALVRHFAPRAEPVGPPLAEGRFEPLRGETLSLMGGAEVFQMQDRGTFEFLLQRAYPDRRLKVRNLGWPSDTVYRQQRPMYFYAEQGDTQKGSVPDLREKVTPGTFLMQFGKMESLDGAAALDDFATAYDGLIKALSGVSRRLVLIQPSPFRDEGPAGSLAGVRNETLELYQEKIRELARTNEIAVFGSFEELVSARVSVTGDESLRAAILRKNHLWDQYYRPTNWAFLFGDRQHVPSSRDHRDVNRRWFVEEIEKLPPLIAEAEETIWKLAKEVGHE